MSAQADLEAYRSELYAHLYRMLGSAHDAEDAVQETLLRAWRALDRFEGRGSLRAWLYRIATNVALTAIERRGRLDVPEELEPFPDEALGPHATAEQRESVELAFIAALQHLPPNQRAALLLRDVCGLSAAEVAEAMETTVASVNSALQHARATVRERLPEGTQGEALRALGDERLRRLVDRYVTALEEGDIDAMIELLADDATWSMPPLPDSYTGHPAIREFLVTQPMAHEWRHAVTAANGQLAIAGYLRDPDGMFRAYVIDVLELRGEEIASITAFIDGSRFAAFGLPAVMPGPPPR